MQPSASADLGQAMQPQGHRIDTDLRRIAASGGGVDAIAARAVGFWQGADTVLVPIIGQRGMSALYDRATHLSATTYPWLAAAAPVDDAMPAYAALSRALSLREADDAIAAAALLFDTFQHLLVTLIGASLTERLLQPIWDLPSAGPHRQDTAP